MASKPGVTGLGQVSGRSGLSLEDSTHLDVHGGRRRTSTSTAGELVALPWPADSLETGCAARNDSGDC